MMSQRKLCFIGGTGRSGTTIFKRLISSHSDSKYIHEWRAMIDPDGLVEFYCYLDASWDPYSYNIRLNRLETILDAVKNKSALTGFFNKVLYKFFTSKFNLPFYINTKYYRVNIEDFSPNFSKITGHFLEDLQDFSYTNIWTGGEPLSTTDWKYFSYSKKSLLKEKIANYYSDVIDDMLKVDGKSIYVEDNTWNILKFDKIIEIIPEAKLVHVHRHPLDVISSYTKQKWMPNDIEQCAVVYRDIIYRWWDIRDSLKNDSFLEISLLDIVNDTENVLKTACSHYGITFEKRMLEIDLSKSNSGRWKKEIDQSKINRCIEILQPILTEYKYTIE